MEKDRREVFGSYTHPDEAISAIEKLKEDGYTKEQITVYSKADGERSFVATEKDSNPKNETGDFDTVDKNSKERSEEGSFDKVDIPSKDSKDKDSKDTEDNEDDSVWEKVKNFFTPDSYDYDKEAQNPNYRQENDVLYPHRQDIANGNRVVVLDKPLEDENRVQI